MSALSSISEKVQDGIFELKPEVAPLSSFFNPTVVLCERDIIGNFSASLVKSISEGKYRKGVYITLDTDLIGGRYNAYVGSGGFGKKKDSQTLFKAIADQASRDPDDIEGKNPYINRNIPYINRNKWDKAILICDWEHDIQFRKIYANAMIHDHDKYIKSKPVSSMMKDDVKLARSFCNIKLKEYENSGSIRIIQNRQNKSDLYISNFYDSDRYEYYVHLALKFVECLIPDFAEKPKPEIKPKDKLYAEFDSEATVLDSKKIRVDKFKIGNRWASIEQRKEFKEITRDAATRRIREANGRKPAMSANRFWHVIKNDKLQPIINFEFEESAFN